MTKTNLARRRLLRQGALAAAALGLAPRLVLRASAAGGGARPVFVCLFLRGGVDGLDMLVPHGEPRYYELRPGIGLPAPGSGEGSVLDLDGRFGLHPALEPLLPAFQSGELAAVHACGSPFSSRSHFEAQDLMETGTPDPRSPREGWLGRHLRATGGSQDPLYRAVALGDATPLSLAGPSRVLSIANLRLTKVANGMNEEIIAPAIEELYSRHADVLGRSAREALEAVETARALREIPSAVEYPEDGLGEQLRDVATMIRADVGLEVAFIDVGGWDTHERQGSTLPLLLDSLARSLAAFRAHLDDRLGEVCLLTMSEFGRTAAENGSGGTDHGSATAMLALGGPVAGGLVHGDWPGLAEEQLYEGRDLALATDYRTLLAEIVHRHLGNPDPASVFPGFAYDDGARLGILRT